MLPAPDPSLDSVLTLGYDELTFSLPSIPSLSMVLDDQAVRAVHHARRPLPPPDPGTFVMMDAPASALRSDVRSDVRSAASGSAVRSEEGPVLRWIRKWVFGD